MVPFRDFDDPQPSGAPRDSSAAAIVASAMRDMATLNPETVQGRRWHSSALEMRGQLCRG